MIGKAKSITHVAAAIDYAAKKEKATLLVKEKVIGDTGIEIAEDFRMFQRINPNCRNNAFSVVLSPSVEDGRQLDDKALRDITRAYLEKMNLADHQYAAFVHHDKAHKHIHLFINRINTRGEAANDSYIGKRSQRVADEIAQEKHLVRAKGIQEEKEKALKHQKAKVKQAHLQVMEGAPTSFESYARAMQDRGVSVVPSINKQGLLQGFRVETDGVSMKASQVWNGMTLKKIEPMFERSTQQSLRNQKDRNPGLSL